MEVEILPPDEQIELLLNGKAHSRPCDEGEKSTGFPKWFDAEKYRRGQIYMRNNIFVQFICMLCGLISVLAIPSILSILNNTYRSSTVITSYRRYLSTVKHVYSWITDDLKPDSLSWKSLTTVRSRHLRASQNSMRRGNGHISQRDMAFTQFGFCGFMFLRQKHIGADDTNFDDYLHFWRTIGYMMGIEDRFNICRPSTEESRQVFEAICREVYYPLLINPPEYFYNSVSNLIDGAWYMMPPITKKSLMYMVYALIGIPGFDLEGPKDRAKNTTEPDKKYSISVNNNIVMNDSKDIENTNNLNVNIEHFMSNLSPYERFMVNVMTRIKNIILQYRFGKWYLNSQISVMIYLTDKFPFLCFKKFGWKKSFINMFEEDATEFVQLKTNKEMGETF